MKTTEMIEKITEIAKEFSLKFAVLFGSAAVGKMTENSDIDIAVLHTQTTPLTTQQFFDLMDKLGNVFETENKKIDLVDLAKANTLLRYEVVMNGKLLYGHELDFYEYKLFAFKDYMDSRSLFDLEKKLIARRQQFLAQVVAQSV